MSNDRIHSRATTGNTFEPIIDRLLSSHQERALPKGAGIFHLGGRASLASILTRGTVKFVRSEPEGTEMIISLRSAPSVLGLEAFLRGAVYGYTAVALSDISIVTVPRTALNKVCQEIDGSEEWFQQALCDEHAELLARLCETGCLPARHRLEYLISDFIDSRAMEKAPRGVKVHLPLKDWEVAQFLCISKEHLSRLLHQLQCSGVLRRERGYIIVDQPQILKKRSGMRSRTPYQPVQRCVSAS